MRTNRDNNSQCQRVETNTQQIIKTKNQIIVGNKIKKRKTNLVFKKCSGERTAAFTEWSIDFSEETTIQTLYSYSGPKSLCFFLGNYVLVLFCGNTETSALSAPKRLY